MTSRDLALVSISAALGALASIAALRLIHRNPRQPSPHPSRENGSVNESPVRSPFDPARRNGYLSWDDYFMAIAFLSAKRSKDPNRQVGACLVSQSGVILGIGYNGFPRGCSDEKLPWAKKSVNGDPLDTKYPYVVHAEVNAILNTNHASAIGQRLYVTMFPCNECAKIIIQSDPGARIRLLLLSPDLEITSSNSETSFLHAGSGVSEVIYFIEKRLGNSDAAYIASHKLLTLAGIKVRKHQPHMTEIPITFEDS